MKTRLSGVFGIIGGFVLFAGLSTLDGSFRGAPLAEAGLKKIAKKAKKTTQKATSTVDKTAGKAVSTARKTADDVVGKVTSELSKALSKVVDLLAPSKNEPEVPKHVAGMFAKLTGQSTFSWTNAYLLTLATKLTYNSRETAQAALGTMGLGRFTWLHEGVPRSLSRQTTRM